MSGYIPSLGSESTSAEDPVKEVAKAAAGSSLCSECFHVEVCAVLLAARTLMPDGGFDVSSCAMFFPTPKADEPCG